MRKSLLAALLALLASGCMIGPDYLRPQVETPPAWRLSDTAANDLANTAWWKQFDDPVLDDLVSTALRENHDLMIATARIEDLTARYAALPHVSGATSPFNELVKGTVSPDGSAAIIAFASS